MELKEFYDYMEQQKHRINAVFIFVYNDEETYDNDPHLEECFDNVEVHEILDSVSDLFEEILSFGSEKDFISWVCSKRNFTKKIYVYTMAQNIEGYSRRTLIPAICEYFNFININASAYMSALGCNKEAMYKLLDANHFSKLLAPTIFFDNLSKVNYNDITSILGEHIIIKPINESCCIDVFVLNNYSYNELIQKVSYLLSKYKKIMLQKFIPGKEIGITVFFHKKNHIALEPIEIVFSNGKQYLTHDDSFYGNYQLQSYTVPDLILMQCEAMSKTLGFDCVTRYDFRIDHNHQYYMFDLSPNPTINGFTSCNFAARASLNCDHRGILRLMVYEKLYLFEPSFNRTK